MALFLQSPGAMPPTEAINMVIQQEVQLMSLIFLVGIFLVFFVYTGFYAFIYKSADCVRRSDEVKKAAMYNKNCRRRWFQPFCNLNADPDNLESTEWMGHWSSDCEAMSCNSADDELSD